MSVIEKFIVGMADKAPPKIAGPLKAMAPLIGGAAKLLDQAIPHIVKACKFGQNVYENTPSDLLYAVFGLCLCFFGGNFPLAIAAVEAMRQCGFSTLTKALGELADEVNHLKLKSEEDDTKDDDNDGIADVHQITPSALVARKFALYLTQTKDPERISTCFTTITTIFAGVIATLKLQFARTVSLGVTIGECLKPLAEKSLLPLLQKIVPASYHKWLPTLIGTLCKSIAVTIAWTIQRVISAVHSASRGGLMFSRHGIKYLVKQGYISHINLDETYIDEAVGWSLAVVGIYFQLSNWFGLPFPFWIVMMPVSIVEYVLQWIVTWD